MSTRFNAAGALRIENEADLVSAISLAERMGFEGTAHLLLALYCGRIAFLPLQTTTSASFWKRFVKATTGRPTVVLIGDDDHALGGPSRFLLARRVIGWAKGALVHAAAADRRHYESAIVAAEALGRVAIIECSAATANAWVAAAECVPHKLLILPRDGVHPVPSGRMH